MRRTRIAVIAATGALVAAGTGVAVATTRSDDAEQREQAVLEDAAKQLDVEPSELRDALSQAQDEQLDADVKAGRLTQEQADAIKQRRAEAGTVLGPGGGPPGHFFGHGRGGGPGFHGGPGDLLGAAADALGLSIEQLAERLRDGDTLGEVAKAEGKDFADVRTAVRRELKEHLDEAVENGPLTRERADAMLDEIVEHLDEFGGGFRGFGGHHDGPRPAPPQP